METRAYPNVTAETMVDERPTLQSRIDMAGTSTFRGITGDVEKIALFMALGTDLRWSGRCNGVSTVVALPVGQAAIWTDIPDELT